MLRLVIDSFEKLEIMRLFRDRGTPHSTAEVGRSLSLPADACELAIRELHRAGVLARQDDKDIWGLAPAMEHKPALDALYQLYETNQIEVMKVMGQLAIDRVRAEAARTFADAFLLRSRAKEQREQTATDEAAAPGSLVLKPTR